MDIVQLFGTGSVPVIVFWSVLGVFELGERFASQRAKDALTQWLVSFDIQKAKALPDGTQEIFERIFGERHFSWKCFVRSAIFSLGAMAFLAILALLIYPKRFFDRDDEFFHSGISQYGVLVLFTVWLPWSILIDYVSLFKTRVVLRLLSRMRRSILVVSIAILIADYLLYNLLFGVGMALMWLVAANIVEEYWATFLSAWLIDPGVMINATITFIVRFTSYVMLRVSLTDLYSIFFWAGFAPSLWMWLYVFALFVTRTLLRSERLVNWLRWGLDVEKAPFRSIGAVAATLAFIASVAIILVSAEVSRISTAA
jgi:hypothetical protein